MKRLIFLALVILAILVANLLIVRHQTAYKSRLNEAVAQITPIEIKEAVAVGCQVMALQRRDDYPGVIKYKSVAEIKKIILAQPASC